jgi:hypothetical protein
MIHAQNARLPLIIPSTSIIVITQIADIASTQEVLLSIIIALIVIPEIDLLILSYILPILFLVLFLLAIGIRSSSSPTPSSSSKSSAKNTPTSSSPFRLQSR